MRKLAVFGNPVGHSRSPEIHLAFAAQAKLDISYEKILAPEGQFVGKALQFIADGGMGFNVTVPFKGEAYTLVDHLSKTASETRTVNTVAMRPDGSLFGDSTDGAGLVRDLTINLDWSLAGKRLLVLGAGGAVRGVLPSLQSQQPASIHLYNRTISRAEELARRFPGVLEARTASQLEDSYDVVISGTSAGLTMDHDVQAKGLPPSRIIGDATCCYDLIYGKGDTPFNTWAMACGAALTRDGLGMLVEQAACAFDLWFGYKPDTAPVIKQLRLTLEETDE